MTKQQLITIHKDEVHKFFHAQNPYKDSLSYYLSDGWIVKYQSQCERYTSLLLEKQTNCPIVSLYEEQYNSVLTSKYSKNNTPTPKLSTLRTYTMSLLSFIFKYALFTGFIFFFFILYHKVMY